MPRQHIHILPLYQICFLPRFYPPLMTAIAIICSQGDMGHRHLCQQEGSLRFLFSFLARSKGKKAIYLFGGAHPLCPLVLASLFFPVHPKFSTLVVMPGKHSWLALITSGRSSLLSLCQQRNSNPSIGKKQRAGFLLAVLVCLSFTFISLSLRPCALFFLF